MATLKVVISNPNYTSATLTRDFFPLSRHRALIKLARYVFAIVSGKAHGSGTTVAMSNQSTSVAATGTVTLASALANDTVTIGNVVFTAVTGTPTSSQFKVGVSDTADALSLATQINAKATINTHVSAASALGVVTITALDLGTVGNLLQLSSSNNSRLAVVAMASGADATVTTYSF